MAGIPMPADAWAIVKRMFDEKRMDYPATEDGARNWTRAVCEQLRFSLPSSLQAQAKRSAT